MAYDTEFELLPFDALSESEDEWESEQKRPAGRRGPNLPAHQRQQTPSRNTSRPPQRPGPFKPMGAPPFRPSWPRPPWPATAPAPCVCPVHGTEYVRWVQSALNQAEGLRLPVDGVMSQATRSALRAFQSRQGLPVDGIAGPDTEEALRRARGSRTAEEPGTAAGGSDSDDSTAGELFEFETLELEAPATGRPTLRKGSRGGAVRDLQQRLAQAGFSPGPIDGVFGSQTDRAVRAFQQARRLVVDGIVGTQTWGALASSNLPLPDSSGTPSPQWQLPDSVRQAGERQYVRYDSPPAWAGNPGNCSETFTAGARILKEYLKQKFPAISSIGGYNCRQNTANSKETSVHGVGRALDIYLPMVSGMANSQAGDPVANWLVEHAQEIGIQYIIWNRTKWNGSSRNGRKDGRYGGGGRNPHIDHIHAELNLDAAMRRTSWFKDR